jgi:hypothetical protein
VPPPIANVRLLSSPDKFESKLIAVKTDGPSDDVRSHMKVFGDSASAWGCWMGEH